MKALLFWVVVGALAIWIVDSSGCGYNKWTPVGNTQEAQRLLSYAPVQAYIHTDKADGMLTEYAGCKDLITVLSRRQRAQRYSILGRKLYDKAAKPTNYIWLRFSNHDGFQPWLKWSDPVQDLGPEAADYIKDQVWRYPTVPGFQALLEPEFTRLKL